MCIYIYCICFLLFQCSFNTEWKKKYSIIQAMSCFYNILLNWVDSGNFFLSLSQKRKTISVFLFMFLGKVSQVERTPSIAKL